MDQVLEQWPRRLRMRISRRSRCRSGFHGPLSITTRLGKTGRGTWDNRWRIPHYQALLLSNVPSPSLAVGDGTFASSRSLRSSLTKSARSVGVNSRSRRCSMRFGKLANCARQRRPPKCFWRCLEIACRTPCVPAFAVRFGSLREALRAARNRLRGVSWVLTAASTPAKRSWGVQGASSASGHGLGIGWRRHRADLLSTAHLNSADRWSKAKV